MLNPSASNAQSASTVTAASPVHEISPERKERIFKSLENVLAELDDLKKSLANALVAKSAEIQMTVSVMSTKIQHDTDEKISILLSDSQKLLAQLDQIRKDTNVKLEDMSQTQKINESLNKFEQRFATMSLSELSEMSSRLKQSVRQRIKDLD